MPDPEVYNFQFPNLLGEQTQLSFGQRSILFILGANGTGKSGLIHKLYSQNIDSAKRISAHRQTWFESNVLSFTPANKVHTETSIKSYDSNFKSRWQDGHHGTRAQITIFDLINAQNQRARNIADAFDADNITLAKKISEKEAPLKTLNHLLKLSNIPIEISVEKDEKVLASKNGGPTYSIAELSDGERNALLIASDVLTAKENTLFIIDEPERHLHRSIISPLLTSLFQKRSDCAFVISTHDISLPLDNPEADILLVRECQWSGNNIQGWDADLISSAEQIDYQIKQDILGSRRTLIFVEGAGNSLDLHIYQILFPEASIVPHGSCSDVERAVYGITSTDSLHWIKALGLIDSDDRSASEINALKNKNVYALPCFSVESIYYCPEIIEQLAARSVEMQGGDASQLEANAKASLITAVTAHKDRLCARLCERKVKQKITPPDWKKILDEINFNITLDLVSQLNEERARFDGYISNQDVASIIARYPIRETPALDEIARALNFSSRKNYEAAVRKLLIDDGDVRNQIKAKFGDLVQAFEDNSEPEAQQANVG